MDARDFNELVTAKWDEKKFLCVGLDSDFDKLPEHLKKLGVREGVTAFNLAIIEATKDIAAAYKPNSAFYEAYGEDGIAALKATCDEIRAAAPNIAIILDAKRGDIGSTNEGYVDFIFGHLGADAVTLQPYLGRESLEPFLSRTEKGIIVLCRTSNKGAGEFQDLSVGDEMLYQFVARQVHEKWNTNNNCWLVVGATYPEEMKEIRAIATELPFLIPGIGAQGGHVEAAVHAGRDKSGRGFLINAARSIQFASNGEDFAEAAAHSAQELNSAIQKAL